MHIVPVSLFVLCSLAAAQSSRPATAEDFRALAWRSVGPANMGGRVAALALVPGSRKAFFAGFATGGVWKTDNLGVTFQPVFDQQQTQCIGAIACADEKVVWVGTGEGNGRNSSSWGCGVFRSTDGGATWKHCGLAATHDIPRLALDPRNPEVCYVAALGRLWGPNPERGLYKTSDGGKQWELVLAVDDATGCCDVVVDPKQPDTVYAAFYARRRTPWSFTGNSEKGGIFKSEDAGRSWRKLAQGLPARTGRIGLALFPADPKVIFTVVESDEGGSGNDPIDANYSPKGGVFRSEDGGASFERTSPLNFRPFYFGRIAVDPADRNRVYLPGWDLAISDDGGRTFRRSGSENVHVDFHAIVVNPLDPEQILVGNDGGIYVSHDRAKTWDYLNRIAVGQFYKVACDNSDPYRIGGGLQDNGSWIGPSQTLFTNFAETKVGITNQDWQMVYFGDGFGVAFDPEDKNLVYATSQGGELARIRLDTNVRKSLRPVPREGQQAARFNWDAPFLISRHDASVLYHGGNRVFRLTGRGDYWNAISPDLTHNDATKVQAVGSGAETYGTVVALAESPRQRGTLWAGSDDGRIHVTTNDGGEWTDVTPEQAKGLHVACLEASHADLATAYAAIDGHRSDVLRPIVVVTRDLGKSWQELGAGLPPDLPVKVVREDPRNPDVLWLGTEGGVHVSLDRGATWLGLRGKSLPAVRVDDLQIHPREHDVILGTHGRSIWILDAAGAFAQLTAETRALPLALLSPRPGKPRLYAQRDYGAGHGTFGVPNPPLGACLDFWVRDESVETAKLAISDAQGLVLRELEAPARKGLNRIVWDLQADKKHVIADKDDTAQGQTRFVAPGTYKLKVRVGELEASGAVEVR